MADNPQYPAPETQLTFTEIVRKILDDTEYARFIHGEVLTARDETKAESVRLAAADNVDRHFKLSPDELTKLRLPSDFDAPAGVKCCTHTRTTLYMLDFATPAKIWPADESAG